MYIVFAIDALEYNLIDKFNCQNLKQLSFGKTDITEFSEPRTVVLWSSFLSGENKEEEIMKLGDKDMWFYKMEKKKTFLSKFEDPIAIDVPGYSYEDDQHKKERELLKDFFQGDGNKEEILAEYDKISFNHHKEIKDKFYKALEEDHDFVLGYFSLVDVIGHLSFGNEMKMKMIYKEMDEIAAKLKEEHGDNKILIVSDHGMKALGQFGDHSEYGFWSLNKESDLSNPKITDFYGFISG